MPGNSANAFYNGTNDGDPSALKALILDPANWTTSAANTAPQTWPTWAFPKALEVTSVEEDLSTNTIVVTFDGLVDTVNGADVLNYEGIENLGTAVVSGNQVTLTYTAPFVAGINTLLISNIAGTEAQAMACSFVFEFDGTLGTADFNKNNNAFVLYPNPSDSGIVYFNRTASVTVFDTTGKLLLSANDVKSIDTTALSSGLYLVKTSQGDSVKLLVK